MKIKPLILAAAATCMAGSLAGGNAQAQQAGFTFSKDTDSVTLYGLIEATISSKSNADSNGDHLNSFQVAWFSGNRWGLTGKHDLGTEYPHIIFRLESEYELPTGSMDTPGVLFNRDAWLGFESDDLGKLTFGRQNALGRDIVAGYLDPYGAAAASTNEGGGTNVNNFKQLIFYAGSATGTRYDNGIVWKKKIGDLVAAAGYQFGGVAGQFSKGSTETGALAYDGSGFNLAGYFTHANVDGLSNKAYSIGGNVQAGIVRVNAGYFNYTADQGASGTLGQRKDNAYTISASLPSGKMEYTLGYQVMKATHAAYNGGGNILNAFNDASGATTFGSGNRKTVYGAVMYHFDKRTDAYVAADSLSLTDGYTVGGTNGHNSQTELAIGLRYKF